MNRRKFLKAAATFTALTAANIPAAAAAPQWAIGCSNTLWSWHPAEGKGIDIALDGAKEAGFKFFGLVSHRGRDRLIRKEATPEYLDDLKKRIAARGLRANMARVYVRTNGTEKENKLYLREQIEKAHRLELEWLLSDGVPTSQGYPTARSARQAQESYYKLMSYGAAYAAERKIKLAMGPPHWKSASEEIIYSIKTINHPNFSPWFNASQTIYSRGKDPIAELKPVAKYITGFCAMDCAGPKGDFMSLKIQLGAGKVDFLKVFQTLKEAGFNGPILLEGGAKGESAIEATDNARANREFLEKTLASL